QTVRVHALGSLSIHRTLVGCRSSAERATTAGLRAVLGCPVGELSDGLIHALELVFERADHDRCAPASRGDNAGPSPSKPAVALEKRKMRFGLKALRCTGFVAPRKTWAPIRVPKVPIPMCLTSQ